MARTLEHDVFDALIDRMFHPLKPIGEGARPAASQGEGEGRAPRSPKNRHDA